MFPVTVSSLVTLLLVTHVTRAQFSIRDARASGLNLLGQNPCVSKQTCSGNIQRLMAMIYTLNTLNGLYSYYLYFICQNVYRPQPAHGAHSQDTPLVTARPCLDVTRRSSMSWAPGEVIIIIIIMNSALWEPRLTWPGSSEAYLSLSDDSKSLQTEQYVIPIVNTLSSLP